MAREQEIRKYCSDNGFPLGACSSIASLQADTAVEAIKWADKTMIDKACDWLIENFYNHPHKQYFICSEAFDCIEEMVEQFMKAMKEE